jgi:hypothetical protein
MAAFSTLPSMSAGGQGCERAERKHEGESGEMGVRA